MTDEQWQSVKSSVRAQYERNNDKAGLIALEQVITRREKQRATKAAKCPS